MRVVMFPAVGVQNENRYIDILVDSLRAEGVDVVGWTKHFSRQTGDIFHIHWPEIVSEIRERKHHLLRGEWIAYQLFSTAKRIQKNGGAVVYTVHDLYPHDMALRTKPFHLRFMKKFLSVVDVAVALTEGGIPQIRQAIPGLAEKQFRVGHHAHYRQVLGNGTYSLAERKALGVGTGQCLFSFLGSLRANKNPDLVVKAFRGLPVEANYLVMAGGGKPEICADIARLSAGAPNIHCDLRRIPEEDIKKLYSATDILVFPGADYFNSGTIYTALSLNVPVLAAWSPSNAEIQQMVGAQWMHLYKGEFTTQVMEEAKQVLIKRGEGTVCDLTLFEPKRCAQELIESYRTALKSRAA